MSSTSNDLQSEHLKTISSIKEESEILIRLIYRNKNQHGKTYYFNLLNHVFTYLKILPENQ